ncbi:MAG: hypothetical protein ACT4PV_12295 [Planctomycetaceae bacterium]
MSSVHFRTSDIDLQLSGSEAFVTRQLLRFARGARGLDRVEASALAAPAAVPACAAPPPMPQTPAPAAVPEVAVPPAPAAAPERAALPTPPAPPPASPGAPGAPRDELVSLYANYPAADRDPQADAALLFAYYLQRREGLSSLRVGDLLRCCIRVGVDSRNFHRSIGTLTRRGLLQEVRRGESYRISEQGITAVEEKLA